jgi:PAS domain S-box-containing protein
VSASLRARELSLELARERDRFEALTEGATDAILTVDGSGVVRYANPSVESVLGHRPDDVVGDPLTDLVPEQYRAAQESGFERYLDTGERTMDWSGVEFVGLHADGHEVPLEVSLAEFETDGERWFTGIVRDVTERKEREEELAERERLFRSVFEGSFDAMVLVDDDGEYVEVNEAACELFGVEREELVGRSIEEFTAEESDFEADWSEFVDGEEERGEFQLARPDGEVRTVEFAATANILPGRHLSVLRDVSERRAQEQERERLFELLIEAEALADLGSWEYDLGTETADLSETAAAMFGVDPDEAQPAEELLAPYTDESRERLSRAFERARETERDRETIDLELELAEGHPVDWVHAHARITTGGDGPGRIRGAVQDISERRERERELEQALDRLDRAQTIADIGAWEHDLETGEVHWTAGMYHVYGVPESFDPTIQTVPERYHPEDRERLEDATAEAIKRGTSFDVEVRLDTEAERWVRVQGEAVTEDGWTTMVRGTTQDVTDRKERERALESTRQRLEQAVDATGIQVWEFDPASETVTVVQRDEGSLIGIGSDEFPLERVVERVHAEDRDRLRAALSAASTGRARLDETVRAHDDETDQWRWLELSGELRTDVEERLVVGLTRDVTEQRRREQSLERTVDLFRATQEIANVGGWEYDPATDELRLTEEAGRIGGLDPGAVIDAETAASLYHPEDEPVIREAVESLQETGEPFDVELRLVLADGEQTWVRVQGELVEREDADAVIRGAFQDVTTRKERERALERYETIVEAAPDPIYALDAEGRFTLANRALAEELDHPRESLLGAEATEFISPPERDRAVSLTRRLAEENREQGTVELTLETHRGNREFEINVALLNEEQTGGVTGTVGVARDVTELHERERHISVLDRVLRHNLRNKMNVVLGNAAEIRRTGDDDVGDAAASIVEAGEKLLALSDAARRFHDTIHSQEPVEETDVVEHVQHVLQETSIEYPGTKLHADLPASARAEVTESFELALSEVVQNAIVHSDQDVPEVSVTVETDDGSVLVRVDDDGPGLDDLERRALERGVESPLEHTSGLGLWLVRWAVEASGGSIEISEREPHGTVVELRVPAVDG